MYQKCVNNFNLFWFVKIILFFSEISFMKWLFNMQHRSTWIDVISYRTTSENQKLPVHSVYWSVYLKFRYKMSMEKTWWRQKEKKMKVITFCIISCHNSIFLDIRGVGPFPIFSIKMVCVWEERSVSNVG